MLSIIFILTIIQSVSSQTKQELIDPIKLIQQNGYPAETHRVITEDGYILVLHRIPFGRNGKSKEINSKPVLLSHGMTLSGVVFLDMGPEKSLGYVLADAGYDVWLLNSRGNSYSTQHLTIDQNINPSTFYNYSWHEIGQYDLPASIDYILAETKRDGLHFIGHSQGGTVFLVMGSCRPEYNKKIKLAVLLAASGVSKVVPSSFIKFFSSYITEIEALLGSFQIHRVPLLGLIRSTLRGICSNKLNIDLCLMIYDFVGGFPDTTQFNTTLFPMIFSHEPSDTSTKQFFHYGQVIKSKNFQQYNYGLKGNRLQYGTDNPPEYNLSLVAAPIAIFYSKNDRYVSIEDSTEMIKTLPNVVYKKLIGYRLFNHGDYLYATGAKSLVYNKIIKVMDQH